MASKIIKKARMTDGYTEPNVMEIMIDSAEDVASLPEECEPGSIAYTADMSYIVQLNMDGEWEVISGDGSSASGGSGASIYEVMTALASVEEVEELSDSASVLIEDGGEVKRVAKDKVGGGSGGGDAYDLVIKYEGLELKYATADRFKLESGDYVSLKAVYDSGRIPKVAIHHDYVYADNHYQGWYDATHVDYTAREGETNQAFAFSFFAIFSGSIDFAQIKLYDTDLLAATIGHVAAT